MKAAIILMVAILLFPIEVIAAKPDPANPQTTDSAECIAIRGCGRRHR